jgi:hypothetical protein
MAKKTRSDAHPLDRFREDLDQWLFTDNLSYKEALERLSAEHGYTCSSGALSRWRQSRAQGRMLEEIAAKAKFSRDVVAQFSESNGKQEAAFKAMLQQVAFDLVSSPNPDPTALAQVIGAALKAGDQELKAAALSLDRSKFEFDAAKAAMAALPALLAIKRDTSLTEDDKLEQARLKLFGSTPA